MAMNSVTCIRCKTEVTGLFCPSCGRQLSEHEVARQRQTVVPAYEFAEGNDATVDTRDNQPHQTNPNIAA